MILRRFFDDGLAQASWLVACPERGEALVVDPNRDVRPYLAAAEAEGLRLLHVAETHIHEDFLSGARELARRAGARLHLSAAGGAEWSYRYAVEEGAALVRGGDSFRVGSLRVDVLHTPGHTAEHLSFAVAGTADGPPVGVLTGDFLLASDVGRPDPGVPGSGAEEAAARTLFRSLRWFSETLPDAVRIWPGRGFGTGSGGAPRTTLGDEKLFNWALRHTSESAFVAEVLAEATAAPLYFGRMKRVNRDGPPPLGELRRPQRVVDARLDQLLGEGVVVVDTRPGPEWLRQHIPGTLSVPLEKRFAAWAGSVVPFDQPLVLLVDEPQLDRAVRDLGMIGMDRLAGWLPTAALDGWVRAHGRAGAVPAMEPADVQGAGICVIDVRNPAEWSAGHIPGSINAPLGLLPALLEELPRDRRLVVHCRNGARSSVAVSFLRARGFAEVAHLRGDWSGWPGRREAAGEITSVAL